MTQKEEIIEQLEKKYLAFLPVYADSYDPEKIMKLHNELLICFMRGRNIDDLINKLSAVEEPKPEVRPAFTAAIIGSRAYRSKTQDTTLGDVLRDTLNSVISLGGRASAEEVSEKTKRQSNIESSYLRDLWEKGLLLTRKREGRVVFYSTPERAILDILKITDRLSLENLMKFLSEYAYDHRIERETMLSIIDSTKSQNLVKTEGDIVFLA
ncbi:MAG TPA: hypothetical protein VER35_01885 [Candidatus Limnocylindrales bacterium]|nr:hypothetical protein [Candidatus Limnocylindrales bacterium]